MGTFSLTMKVALLAFALFSVALASPVPVGNMAYDAGYEDCEEIDVLPAQQMEPFFIEQPIESFAEEDCEEEDSFIEEPAFVDQALNIVNDYEVEDCEEEDEEYAAPALIERDQAVDNFFDEECEDEESLPALPAAPQVFEEEEADCEDEGEFMEPFAAAPLDFRPSNSVDPLDAAQHAYLMEPQMMGGSNPSEEFEDCEDEPYFN